MKQFKSVFKFEFMTHIRSKSFIAITLIGMAVCFIMSFLPTFFSDVGSAIGGSEDVKAKAVLVKFNEDGFSDETSVDSEMAFLSETFKDYDFEKSNLSVNDMREEVKTGNNNYAIVYESRNEVKFIIEKVSLDDRFVRNITSALNTKAKLEIMNTYGIGNEEALDLLHAEDYIVTSVDITTSDQTESFWYTYILLFALYMAIMMYGQMIAQNVASEKGTRAMEMLITSAKPTSLMFGKVIAGACAGFVQLFLIFGTAFVSYSYSDVSSGGIVSKMIGMPMDVLIYVFVFFVLGFLFYAFIYAALGSLANRVEDISMLITPITMVYVIAFILCMFSMSSGNVDSTLMIVCSYIPFTSPMVLFVRITMGNIIMPEIIIGIAILTAFVFAIGVLASKIYKMGVTMYGNAPKFKDILKLRKKNNI